jgi:hypothetical protein
MNHLQLLKEARDRFEDHALVLRKKFHNIGQSALKSLERKPSESSCVTIDIVRDICDQPVALQDQLQQQSFPRFAEFPTEIRLLIWHFASLTERVVELQWSEKQFGFRNCAAPRPPAVLHACRDARKEALNILQPYFSMKGHRNPIYIDPMNDILFFRTPPGSFIWSWRLQWMRGPDRQERMKKFREDLKGIRRVAFLQKNFKDNSMPISVDSLYLLPDLEELNILWAGWSYRPFVGRGVNLIEGVSPCVHHENENVRQAHHNMNGWEERLALETAWRNELGWRMPTMKLRHWCLRDMEKEINVSSSILD